MQNNNNNNNNNKKLTSCKLVMIPKNAQYVTHIHTQSNLEKQQINLQFKDFSENELKECEHGIENPICKPLLIITTRLGLYSPD